ncbi:MAG: hypothetical protein IT378_07295 [Sandaracinaceae bacterium]|nr:hypothetical protein [Sandaracinaceae bacterium]
MGAEERLAGAHALAERHAQDDDARPDLMDDAGLNGSPKPVDHLAMKEAIDLGQARHRHEQRPQPTRQVGEAPVRARPALHANRGRDRGGELDEVVPSYTRPRHDGGSVKACRLEPSGHVRARELRSLERSQEGLAPDEVAELAGGLSVMLVSQLDEVGALPAVRADVLIEHANGRRATAQRERLDRRSIDVRISHGAVVGSGIPDVDHRKAAASIIERVAPDGPERGTNRVHELREARALTRASQGVVQFWIHLRHLGSGGRHAGDPYCACCRLELSREVVPEYGYPGEQGLPLDAEAAEEALGGEAGALSNLEVTQHSNPVHRPLG